MRMWQSNPALDARLLPLWDLGHTASEISRTMTMEFGMDVSRNAVLGRVHRLMLPPRKVEERKPKATTPRVYVPKPAKRAVPKIEPLEMNPTPFEFAANRQCRYPLWDDSQSTGDICGGKTGAGESYCDFHRSRVFAPTPKKRDAA